MNKKWECYNIDDNKVEELVEQKHISNLLASILVNRGITEEKELEVFLNPTRKDFYDPFLLPDMEIAVDRIIKAVNNKEKIMIYGDYDADGITSVSVLKKYLNQIGLETGEYIPNRLNEGYGLNKEAILKIYNMGYKLMVTVDCGISGLEEVEYANTLGIAIITDHHEPAEQLPNAIAVIDAKRKDNIYPFNQLAGVGVVFKLIQAISIKLNLDEKEYLKYLDLVCIGTISDIVPLVDENRVIAKLGLKLIEQTKNIGLRTLLNIANFKKIDSNAISFGVAPRINACGRMGAQEEALKLFLTEDKQEALKIAKNLVKFNQERQNTEKQIFEDVIQEIEKNNDKEKKCIVLAKENWHHGIIGIVSSKVTEMYYKPSILICLEGDMGKGSGRSVSGFDLYNALSKCNNYIEKFGGHSMAIGISIKKENFEKLKAEIEKCAEESNISDIMPIINIDKRINLKDISIEEAKSLELLEPFGEANKMPIFLIQNLKIDSIRALSDGKHLKLTLKQDNYIIDAIGFNMGELSKQYLLGDKVDVVGTIEINTFGNKENIQMNLKDIRKAM